MQQNELATLLGISPAMVSRLKKQGMPIANLDRAQRWRKRHLEPSRIKGSRFDPMQIAKPPKITPSIPAQSASAGLADSLAKVEAIGAELDRALTAGEQAWTGVMIKEMRDSLRNMGLKFDPDDKAEPRLSLRVWVALTEYVFLTDDLLERASNRGELLTPVQFDVRRLPNSPTYPLQNHHLLSHACDWNDFAITGFPDCPEDDEFDTPSS